MEERFPAVILEVRLGREWRDRITLGSIGEKK